MYGNAMDLSVNATSDERARYLTNVEDIDNEVTGNVLQSTPPTSTAVLPTFNAASLPWTVNHEMQTRKYRINHEYIQQTAQHRISEEESTKRHNAEKETEQLRITEENQTARLALTERNRELELKIELKKLELTAAPSVTVKSKTAPKRRRDYSTNKEVSVVSKKHQPPRYSDGYDWPRRGQGA